MSAARPSPQSSARTLSALSAATDTNVFDVKDHKRPANAPAAAPQADVGAKAAATLPPPPAQEALSAFPFINESATPAHDLARLTYQACESKEEWEGMESIGFTLRYDDKFTCVTSPDLHPMLVPVKIINTDNQLEEHHTYDAYTLLFLLLSGKNTSPITRRPIKTLVVDEKLEQERRDHFRSRFASLRSIVETCGGVELSDADKLKELTDGISAEKKKILSNQLKRYGVNIRGEGYPYYDAPAVENDAVTRDMMRVFKRPLIEGQLLTLDYKDVTDALRTVSELEQKARRAGQQAEARARNNDATITIEEVRRGFHLGRSIGIAESQAADEIEVRDCKDKLKWSIALPPTIVPYIFLGGVTSLLTADYDISNMHKHYQQNASSDSDKFMAFMPGMSLTVTGIAYAAQSGIKYIIDRLQHRVTLAYASPWTSSICTLSRAMLESGALWAIEASIEDALRKQQLAQSNNDGNNTYTPGFDEPRLMSLAFVSGITALRMGLFYCWKNRNNNNNYEVDVQLLPRPRGNRNT